MQISILCSKSHKSQACQYHFRIDYNEFASDVVSQPICPDMEMGKNIKSML
jgi:hypothetical protein